MKDSRKWKFKVGDIVEAKLISRSGTVIGKVVNRDGKLMLSCDQVFYHENAIEDILESNVKILQVKEKKAK